jgi:hypothetical protein
VQPVDEYVTKKANKKLTGETLHRSLLEVALLLRDAALERPRADADTVIRRFTTDEAVLPTHAIAVGLVTMYLLLAVDHNERDTNELTLESDELLTNVVHFGVAASLQQDWISLA